MVDRAHLHQDWLVNTGNGPLNSHIFHARGKYGKNDFYIGCHYQVTKSNHSSFMKESTWPCCLATSITLSVNTQCFVQDGSHTTHSSCPSAISHYYPRPGISTTQALIHVTSFCTASCRPNCTQVTPSSLVNAALYPMTHIMQVRLQATLRQNVSWICQALNTTSTLASCSMYEICNIFARNMYFMQHFT